MRRGILDCPTVVAIGLVWLAYMMPALFVVGIDPYDLYPWGVRVKLVTRYDIANTTRLIAIGTGDPQADTILVGSSTTVAIRPEDLVAALPGARTPWNLSYPAAGSTDRLIVLDRIADRSKARHVLVMLDHFLALPEELTGQGFPVPLFDSNFTNDLRVVDARTLRDARTALRLGTPFPDRAAAERAWRLVYERGFRRYLDDPRELAAVAQSLRAHRSSIDKGLGKPCSAFPLLPPFEASIRRLAAQGRRVDVIVPVYSPAFYYRSRMPGALHDLVGDTFLGDQLSMRRCAVEALAQAPNVTVSALDQDLALIGDVSNFGDPGHLRNRVNFRRLLAATLDPRYRLTAANVGGYVERLRRGVKAYCPGGIPAQC